MGCEAYISVARINEGHHLLDDLREKCHVFCVKEPVAIIYIYRTEFGKNSGIEKPTTFIKELDEHIQYSYYQFCVCEEFIICVMPLSDFDKIHDQLPEYTFPGSVSERQAREAWAKIKPGYYLVTSYQESGTTYDKSYYLDLNHVKIPNISDLRLEEDISWEIWT